MIFTSKIMKKRGNDDVKDEACIYDESKVKEIHDIIFSIKNSSRSRSRSRENSR